MPCLGLVLKWEGYSERVTEERSLAKMVVPEGFAVDLIAAREQRMRDQGKDPRAPKGAKKSAAKKAPAKKVAAAEESARRLQSPRLMEQVREFRDRE